VVDLSNMSSMEVPLLVDILDIGKEMVKPDFGNEVYIFR